MDDLLSEFLTETSENLGTLDLELVKLEQDPNAPDLIDNIFRLVHTIKGTCGFLGLPRLEAVAHSAENVLGKVRDHELVVTPVAVSLILGSLDRIKELLAALEATEAEPEGDDGDLIAQLDAMALGADVPGNVKLPEEPEEKAVERQLKAGEATEEELERAFRETEIEATEAVTIPSPAPVAAPPKIETEPPAEKPAESSVASQSIRVSVDVLENLMTMVSELVLTRNQLMQMVRGHADSEFKVPLQRLSHVTTELQEGVMKTRMQPIGNAWAKLPRIVRDLSLELKKKIDLQMLGADTELDRQVLELIKDPLTHMVRNSADHGLETLEERIAAGKMGTGKIVLNAYHEGGHIIIKIRDDGRGINVEKLRAKMLSSGVASEAEIGEMTEQQIQMQIFAAGFSTADKVTAVSGRGVGMDVVRTNIEKIGGTIELESQWGKGSTFTIKIPLTLAIVSALIVESCGDRFAIPQLSVVELVRASKESEHRIEMIKDTPVLRLRNRLLPLVYLGECLKLADASKLELTEGAEVFVVVSQVGSYAFGIVVDRVFDTEEIVVKPVTPLLREIPMFSGNTILGDGSVIMILDPNGIAATTSDTKVGERTDGDDERAHAVAGSDTTTMLIFRAGSDEPKAVPLSLVARLEEIDVDTVEHANGQNLVQYRGKLMPLVKMDDSYTLRESGRQPILVFADGDRSMGLVVDEIIDIVEPCLDIELMANQPGYLGSAVIEGKATNVIDVGHYLSDAFSDWFTSHDEAAFGEDDARSLLLVDDSPFFRNMLTPLLEVAGYKVTIATNGDEALALREAGVSFDCIVSDIEMPGMNGFELAEQLKSDSRWQATPIVALSSHVNPKDLERGRNVGFSDYVGKFDRDALLLTLTQTLAEKVEVA
ncbi:MAG: hybrid sensor histidine kinase/response regulator [Proteobacteria bacterium]|nr:hybrid sensor histidine kinase/response regulator [Pseudomonadota bacterium]